MTESRYLKKDLDFFLGCVAPNRYPMIEAATNVVFEKLGIKLHDLEGASCCPAPGVFRSFDIPTWLAIAARNITIAEQNNHDMIIPCNGCYGTLLEANHIMKTEPERRKKTNEVLGKINRKFKGTTKVKHLVEVLYKDIGLDNLSGYIINPLKGIRAAVHYGCHLLKPSETRPWGKDENPTFFDELVELTGCESVDYRDKFMCCGAGGGVRAAIKDLSLIHI